MLYAVFGDFDELGPLHAKAYRSEGPPHGVELTSYVGPERRDVLDGFRSGWAWDRFATDSPELAAAVAGAPRCLLLRGVVTDPSTLDYFRDVIGLIAYLNDAGGLAVYDAQILRWWSAEEWREAVFARGDLRPSQHVAISFTDDDADRGRWYHTRGMRKFGRPDLSVTHVPEGMDDGALDLIVRFIEFQALGGHVSERQEIRVAGLPPGLECRHAGDAEDVDFNNSHIEIAWPEST